MRQSLKTSNRRIAERERLAIERQLREPHRISSQKKNPTFDEFWPQYIAWAEAGHIGPRTLDRKKDFWTQFRRIVKCERLRDVGAEDVEAFKRWRRREGNAPTTINKALTDLQAIYNRAGKLGIYTGRNPFEEAERFRATKKVPKFHTEEELLRLLHVAEGKPRYIKWTVLLCGWAGLRRNGLVNCRYEWFDFDRRKIRVSNCPGFTIKDHEEREIDMSSRIRDEFYWDCPKEGYLFVGASRSQGRSRYRFDPKRGLIAALQEAGLPIDKPFQRLRISYGSILVSKGVPLKKVSRMMGHASVVTTERHYLGIEPFDDRIDF